MSAEPFPAGANPYRFDVNCNTWASGEQDRLRGDVKAGETVTVHGFASVEGNPKYNEYLSCARAEKAAIFLSNVVGANVLEIHAHGAVTGPRVPRRSVLVYQIAKPKPKPTPAPPPTNVCGPEVDTQLTAVLTDIQSYFRGLSNWRKHRSCQQLESPAFAMAWDIEQLYLPNTSWLRMWPFASTTHPCSLPQAANTGQDREDPATCSNTVRVNGKCNLAGTVNYAAFGIMMSECYDFYDDVPWYAVLLRVNVPLYTESAMKKLITVYKVFGGDAAGPPREFAEATYENGPTGRPSTENRPHCSSPCEATDKPPNFSFVWEPYHGR